MKTIFIAIFFLLFLSFSPSANANLSVNLQGSCPNADDIETSIGCIPTKNPSGITNNIIKIGVGLGGGIALLLILYGVFIITTSSGIPDKLNAGKDIIMSAISGLLLIALSIVILNLIGVNILGLPGLQ